MTIYIFVGRIVYTNRRHFLELSGSASVPIKPSSSPKAESLAFKTTTVHITTSKAFSKPNNSPFDSNSPMNIAPYAAKIESSRVHLPKEQRQAQSIADRAAWAYLKCAMLFFIALLITWVHLPFSFIRILYSPFTSLPSHHTRLSIASLLCTRN